MNFSTLIVSCGLIALGSSAFANTVTTDILPHGSESVGTICGQVKPDTGENGPFLVTVNLGSQVFSYTTLTDSNNRFCVAVSDGGITGDRGNTVTVTAAPLR